MAVMVHRIGEINEVQTEHVGIAGVESENYRNYLGLLAIANDSVLLKLTEDTNAAVACYAGWALIENRYPDLPAVFRKFMENDRDVQVFSGCISSHVNTANIFYFKYLGSIEESRYARDQSLFAMDRMILFDFPHTSLVGQALENRVYPSAFNKQIERLAFQHLNFDAVTYLRRHGGVGYREKIKQSLLQHLQKSGCRELGSNEYYELVQALLQYRDEAINRVVCDKLRESRCWTNDRVGYVRMLENFSIPYEDIMAITQAANK